MDKARLVLDYIEVLRWPAVVVALMVIFRDRLHELIRRVTHAEGPGGFKAQFAEIAEVRALARSEEAESEQAGAEAASAEATAAASSQQKPARGETFRLKIHELADLVTAFQLLDTFDEVVLDLSEASVSIGIQVSGSGMWAIGLEMGSRVRFEVRDRTDEDGLLIIRHGAAPRG